MKQLKDYLYYETALGKLYCGDCLEILPLIEEKVDLVLTDPPYNFKSGSLDGGGLILKRKYLNEIEESFGRNFNPDEFLNIILNITNKKFNLYFWCSKDLLLKYLNFGFKNNLNYDLLLWHKNNPVPLWHNKYISDTEYCIWLKNKGAYFNCNLNSSFYKKYTITSLNRTIQGHPTPKPIILFNKIIMISSKENDLICDPFLGSGTTAVACEKLNRRWIGIEISEKYCVIAKKRIESEANQIKMF